MKLVIRGRPATKKNSSRVVRNGRFIRVLPSKAFVEYERMALKANWYAWTENNYGAGDSSMSLLVA